MLSIDLTGEVALVTGGARGIGAACCRRLAEAGADVAINYSGSERGRRAAETLAEEIAGMGQRVQIVPADVADRAAVHAMFDRVEAELGVVTRLVGNAGTTSRFRFTDLPVDEWQRILDINLTSHFHVLQRALRPMLEQGRGSIVLVTTQATLSGGGGGGHYVASKAGLEGLARHLSRELRPRGIRVNVVQPSAVDTELFRERYPDPRDREAVAATVPAGRLGCPDDIAYAVVFLLSDLADYICGQCLLIDGGRTLFREA